jgi:hypothetical protein
MCRTSSHVFVSPSTRALESSRRGRFEELEDSGSGVKLASRRLCVMGDRLEGRDISMGIIRWDEVVVELSCVCVRVLEWRGVKHVSLCRRAERLMCRDTLVRLRDGRHSNAVRPKRIAFVRLAWRLVCGGRYQPLYRRGQISRPYWWTRISREKTLRLFCYVDT